MSDAETTSHAMGAGARLQQARTRLGLTRIQAAERLRLEPRSIEALESEHFEALGASVYVRGHLRRYAELVGENPTQLEQLYALGPGRSGAPDLTRSFLQPQPAVSRQAALGAWPAALVAGLLALGGLLWWALRESPRRVVVSETVNVPVTAATPPIVAGGTGASLAVMAPTAAPTITAAPAIATTGAARARVKLSFLGDSWTEVYDAAGKRLYYDVGHAGSVLALQGRAPLRLVFDNVAGVVMDLNGRRVRLPADVPQSETVYLAVDAGGQATRTPNAQGAR